MFRRGGNRQRAVKSIPKHLEGAELAYFQANGTYPPFVDPESTAEDIEEEIKKLHSVFEGSSIEDADRITNEIGYLAGKLVELKQATE